MGEYFQSIIGFGADTAGKASDYITNLLDKSYSSSNEINRTGGMNTTTGEGKDTGSIIDSKSLEDQSRLMNDWLKKNQNLIIIASILVIGGVIAYYTFR